MTTVFDVAKYILGKAGQMSAMKLQKLVYYSQAWSLVWDEAPIFQEKIRAWAYGPVVPELYAKHRGEFVVSRDSLEDGDENKLAATQRETVDAVVAFYGDKSPQWLSDLTHREDPWRNARVGLRDGERGHVEITLESMAEYYGSLPAPSAP